MTREQIANAFAAIGPRSMGRRTYDKARWWVAFVKDVGFPIAAYFMIWQLMVGGFDRLTAAVERNTVAVTRLVCVVAPEKCDRQIQGDAK